MYASKPCYITESRKQGKAGSHRTGPQGPVPFPRACHVVAFLPFPTTARLSLNVVLEQCKPSAQPLHSQLLTVQQIPHNPSTDSSTLMACPPFGSSTRGAQRKDVERPIAPRRRHGLEAHLLEHVRLVHQRLGHRSEVSWLCVLWLTFESCVVLQASVCPFSCA